MKKTISAILSLIMMLSLTLTGCAAESETAKLENNTKIVLQIANPNMVVNGSDKPIDENGTVPVILNDRTLLPVRAVVEEMGGTVAWNGETREVTLNCGENEIKLIIDSKNAYLNGEKIALDTAPTIINDRTMLPIRFIAESFHFEVKWEETTQTITIQKIADDDTVAKRQIYITVNGTTLTAELCDNSSAEKLYELLSNSDITVDMYDYSNFEKVGFLPEDLPRNDEQITTEAGDLILYQGNQFVIYYDKNSWNFTKLGKIKDVTQKELKTILGAGNVVSILSLTSKTDNPETAKTLTAYFSCTGNTEKLAENIIAVTNSDSFQIVPNVPYTSDDLNYSDNESRATKEQNNANARPEMANGVDLRGYDTILLGYPIWWGKCPRIILTFLDTYKEDLADKTIIPFCTSGSSPISGSLAEIRNAVPESAVKDGFRGTVSMTEEQIETQLKNNGYSK